VSVEVRAAFTATAQQLDPLIDKQLPAVLRAALTDCFASDTAARKACRKKTVLVNGVVEKCLRCALPSLRSICCVGFGEPPPRKQTQAEERLDLEVSAGWASLSSTGVGWEGLFLSPALLETKPQGFSNSPDGSCGWSLGRFSSSSVRFAPYSGAHTGGRGGSAQCGGGWGCGAVDRAATQGRQRDHLRGFV
jgi:hypothetical protein